VDTRKEWQKGLVSVAKRTLLPDAGLSGVETCLVSGKPQVAGMQCLKVNRPTLFVEGIDSPMVSGTIHMKFGERGENTQLTIEISMQWKSFYTLLGPTLDLAFRRSIKKDFADINNNLLARA